MRHLNNILQALAEVYAAKKYFAYSGLFSLLVFSLNALIGNFKLILSQFSLLLIFDLIISTHRTISAVSFALLVIISVLSGIIFSLSLFLVKRQSSYGAGIGLSGIIASVLTPACSSCALGLAGILGIGGFLGVLPFKGMELGVLGIILLGISLVHLSGKICMKVCGIKENPEKTDFLHMKTNNDLFSGPEIK